MRRHPLYIPVAVAVVLIGVPLEPRAFRVKESQRKKCVRLFSMTSQSNINTRGIANKRHSGSGSAPDAIQVIACELVVALAVF